MKCFSFGKIGAFLLVGGLSLQVFAASEAEFSASINVAGRQRMLTQKMAKEALLVKIGVDADTNKENLTATMKLFEDSLGHLMNGAADKKIPAPPSEDVTTQLTKVQDLWKNYKKALEAQDADKIAAQSNVILKEMNKGVKKYEVASIKAGIKGKGKVINMAGRQRMLTQKMAKEVFLIAAGVSPNDQKKSLKSTKSLFETSLDALQNGSKKMRIEAASSAEIQAQLKVVAGLWAEYAKLIDEVHAQTGKIPDDLLKKIADINPKVLVEMHKAVGMYEG